MRKNAISPAGKDRRAYYLGRHQNRRVYRFHVEVHHGERAARGDVGHWIHGIPVTVHKVTAHTPADAVNLVRDEYAPKEACVSVETWGPRGGRVTRWIGYESHIFACMLEERTRQEQLTLGS